MKIVHKKRFKSSKSRKLECCWEKHQQLFALLFALTVAENVVTHIDCCTCTVSYHVSYSFLHLLRAYNATDFLSLCRHCEPIMLGIEFTESTLSAEDQSYRL